MASVPAADADLDTHINFWITHSQNSRQVISEEHLNQLAHTLSRLAELVTHSSFLAVQSKHRKLPKLLTRLLATASITASAACTPLLQILVCASLDSSTDSKTSNATAWAQYCIWNSLHAHLLTGQEFAMTASVLQTDTQMVASLVMQNTVDLLCACLDRLSAALITTPSGGGGDGKGAVQTVLKMCEQITPLLISPAMPKSVISLVERLVALVPKLRIALPDLFVAALQGRVLAQLSVAGQICVWQSRLDLLEHRLLDVLTFIVQRPFVTHATVLAQLQSTNLSDALLEVEIWQHVYRFLTRHFHDSDGDWRILVLLRACLTSLFQGIASRMQSATDSVPLYHSYFPSNQRELVHILQEPLSDGSVARLWLAVQRILSSSDTPQQDELTSSYPLTANSDEQDNTQTAYHSPWTLPGSAGAEAEQRVLAAWLVLMCHHDLRTFCLQHLVYEQCQRLVAWLAAPLQPSTQHTLVASLHQLTHLREQLLHAPANELSQQLLQVNPAAVPLAAVQTVMAMQRADALPAMITGTAEQCPQALLELLDCVEQWLQQKNIVLVENAVVHEMVAALVQLIQQRCKVRYVYGRWLMCGCLGMMVCGHA
eukprot:TRINITY_DN2705_c0_g1_i1.p1 TRINITY_DN2705_c0_g1~~TRINITY_DN2705_c0_g1_i1.p1  ORF type:complete len:600 (-),score=114.08 TRINITY_DN2705_c0_g1_i1:97-1896(-)